MLRSLGFGLCLETFAKFLMISVLVSKNLVSEIKYRFRFQKIWYRKRSLGFGFRIFGLGKKVSVSVSEKFGIGKKSRYRFRSKFWYRHLVIWRHVICEICKKIWLKSLVSSLQGGQFNLPLNRRSPLPTKQSMQNPDKQQRLSGRSIN